jgi:hypothetical protein
MLELAGLDPATDELPVPSREQFLALNKGQKYAAIGVGLLTMARCNELYDHTVGLYTFNAVDPYLESNKSNQVSTLALTLVPEM